MGNYNVTLTLDGQDIVVNNVQAADASSAGVVAASSLKDRISAVSVETVIDTPTPDPQV